MTIHTGSQIWTPQTIGDIHARTDGGYSLTSFSTFRALPSFDDLSFLAAGLTRFPLEGYKEKCRTETVLGPRCGNPLTLEVPVYAASSSAFPRGVRAALAVGASLANTGLSVGGPLHEEERRVGSRLIYELSAGRVRSVASQTKTGALLLEVGQMTYDSLQRTLRTLRGGQQHRTPIFLRLGAGHMRDEVRAAVKAGADGIVLLGLETPPLSSPEGLSSYCRLPMVAAIGQARAALQENKALGEVSLIAGNGIVTGADAAKALALGADAVALRLGALEAVLGEGAEVSPTEVRGAGERLAKYLNSMVMEVALLARSLGKGDVHSLEFEDLASLTVEASLMSGVRLAGE